MSPSERQYDAIVVGSGPNGLSAAITIAQAGHSVLVLEAQDTIGGGTRSAGPTLPGFVHDVCSAVHPMAMSSPFFRTLPLAQHGLEFIQPEVPLAHPLDDGTAVVVERSVERTAAGLGRDAQSYVKLIGPLVRDWQKIQPLLMGARHFPRHPFSAARFGLHAMRSASALAKEKFRDVRGRALFAGMAAHSILPLEDVPSAAFGLVLMATAHAVGWPIVRGGSQKIADALASHLRSLGGEIKTGEMVNQVDHLTAHFVALFDVSPRQLLEIAGSKFPARFRDKLREYFYGPGVCKMDWALDAPIPWTAKECARAGTVHIGGTLEEISVSERAAWNGVHAGAPFVLLSQPTLFDPSRAPAGKHIAWAYCHVPHGSDVDMSDVIELQIERFAPGFRHRILRRNVMLTAEMQRHNANLIGGDISGGPAYPGQFFLRPTRRLYGTPAKRIYICSASTPPGGGVHGMCGHLAAKKALRENF
ncbi:MAG: NAD(P)/FAD-dependent oxidoreductase [Candidatus Acidiferrales bacterium]